MSLTVIELDTTLTAAQLQSYLLFEDRYKGAATIAEYFRAMAGGVRQGVATVRLGAVQASGTLTITSTGPALGETFTVAGVTFEAVASSPTATQFIRSDTPATAAANIATAINANATLSGIVTAAALAGVVTITAVVPGVMGNGLVLSENAANTAAVSFAGGSNGTVSTLSFL